MDTHTNTLLRRFRHIVSLASLAYIFSAIHAIQFSLLDINMDDDTGNNTVDTGSEDQSGWQNSDFISTNETSSNSGKTKDSGRWTDREISLLLDYVEAHCPLNTKKGLNLTKTQFNKAGETIKSKDYNQCHYK
jgi:hypothetical protein